MFRKTSALLATLLLISTTGLRAEEFRAAWVATVWNIDWPSKPGLTTYSQQRELKAIFDKAKGIGLNTIILQVRPAGDTFYKSPYEPWSAFLTGKMGRAPDPYYDPLQFAVEEAHKRGLKLHAWINPFRMKSGNFSLASNHMSRTHPSWVKTSGKDVWLDPGIPEVREHVLKIVADLVKRYEVDGIHIDDYFYPYPPSNQKPRRQTFNDWGSCRSNARNRGSNSASARSASGAQVTRKRLKPNWTPTNTSVQIPVTGCNKAGVITFLPNCTGASTRKSKVFPCC